MSGAQSLVRAPVNLVEDAEDLVGVDRAQGQIVVGIAPVVEVETAQQAGMQQPGDDLLDVLGRVVMSGIDQDPRLRTGDARQVRRHAPVGDVGVIKRRLKRLVLDQQPLRRRQAVVGGAQGLLQPADALADALRAGIVRAVGQPQGDIA